MLSRRKQTISADIDMNTYMYRSLCKYLLLKKNKNEEK